ncbi:cupin domain-containing protein [Paracidobacterium acidisoli]|uniref:Cupin domain-containing protein n=1 Tax=Paracidobacterium acidisoli TaxID=2303751 RepID=A0A372ITV3_9BACT|nr:cupin domain-containing protein [Paracidobacterium acidisoli]MBT9329779.1 cupin domain-containing protein [Paracidobacterium acidisoli]
MTEKKSAEIAPVRLADRPSSSPEAGLLRQVLAYSGDLMLVRHLAEPGWVGTRHSHSHEQLVYVVRGRIRLACGDTESELAAGDSIIVPGGVEHQARALEDSEILDVFTPCREDYAPQ